MSTKDQNAADEVDLSSRPFLADLGHTANSAPESHARLFAAATGAQLHLVEPEEVASEETDVDQHLTSLTADPASLPKAFSQTPTTRGRRVREDEPSTEDVDGINWKVIDTTVQALTTNAQEARSKQTFDVAIADGPETTIEQAAWDEISDLIDRHVGRIIINEGDTAGWSDERKRRHVQAAFDQAFRYGRLQQLLREEDVEDISIQGFDNVLVTKADGRKESRPPIAFNDEDLQNLIAKIASDRGRVFSRPNGTVDCDLGGARMSAVAPSITSVPHLTIRKHNHIDITLDKLVQMKTIDAHMAQLMTALVRANRSGLISGWAAAGKTTFLRALMSAVDPEEKIVTIETEHELYLNKLSDQHHQVVDLQYLPSTADSGQAAYTLKQAFEQGLRMSAQMMLFGELRGPEGPIAIKAMQAGKGSLSTIHARSADDAIHRFADMLMSEEKLVNDNVPLRQIMRSIDVVFQIEVLPATTTRSRRRVVTQIAEIQSTDDQLPMAVDLVRFNRDTEQWEWDEKPTAELLQALVRAGLDADFFPGVAL